MALVNGYVPTSLRALKGPSHKYFENQGTIVEIYIYIYLFISNFIIRTEDKTFFFFLNIPKNNADDNDDNDTHPSVYFSVKLC